MAKTWRERDDSIMLEFVTGDGKSYYPEFVEPAFSIDMNTVAVEFNNLAGALVRSGKASYRSFDVKFIYQGEDHLEKAEALLESITGDLRECIITHPYYGKIIGRPAGKYTQNNKGLNVSDISFEFWESLLSDSARLKGLTIEVSTVESPVLSVPITKVDKITLLKKILATAAKIKASTEAVLNAIIAAEQQADRYINTIGANAQRFMAQIAYIARAVGKMYDTLKNRIQAIKDSYNDMKNAILGSTNPERYGIISKEDKQVFEVSGSYAMQSLALAASTSKLKAGQDLGIIGAEDEPAKSADEIKFIIKEILEIYNDYIATLGYMQSDKDNKPDSYYPDYNAVLSLQKYVQSAINGLYAQLSGANVEMSYVVKSDIGLKPLVFMLLGTADDDVCIKFAQRNKLSSDELVLIKQDREVFYAR